MALTGMVSRRLMLAASSTAMLLVPPATYTRLPSGLTATAWAGTVSVGCTGDEMITRFVAVLSMLTVPSTLFKTYAFRPSGLTATPSGTKPTTMSAVLNGLGKDTSMLKDRGLMAVSSGVVRDSGPVFAPLGTRVVSVVVLAVSSAVTGVALKSRASSIATGLKPVPTIVTKAPGRPPGGLTKAIRGPSSLAIWVPVNVPWALLAGLVQMPLALFSPMLTAVRTHSFC